MESAFKLYIIANQENNLTPTSRNKLSQDLIKDGAPWIETFQFAFQREWGLYSLPPIERAPSKYDLSSLVMKLFVLDTILIGPLHKICPSITWIGFEPNFCYWFVHMNYCFCMFLVSRTGAMLSTLSVFSLLQRCQCFYAVTQIQNKILTFGLSWVVQWWNWMSES